MYQALTSASKLTFSNLEEETPLEDPSYKLVVQTCAEVRAETRQELTSNHLTRELATTIAQTQESSA